MTTLLDRSRSMLKIATQRNYLHCQWYMTDVCMEILLDEVEPRGAQIYPRRNNEFPDKFLGMEVNWIDDRNEMHHFGIILGDMYTDWAIGLNADDEIRIIEWE